jgi:predicted transcriptional regulator
MSQIMHSDTDTALGWGNRGALDIINLILIVCVEVTMITHIMYRCNLNSKQTQSYVSFLLQYGLLEKKKLDGSNKFVYQATEKGRRYLEVYGELSQIFNLSKQVEMPKTIGV